MPKRKKTDETELDEVLEEELKEELSEPAEPEVGEGKAEEKEGAAPTEVVKVGEKEYTPDQLTKLIEKAERVAGIEKEQNINIEQLYPDYTKKSQLLSNPVELGKFIAEKYGGTAGVVSPEEELRQKAVKEAREVYGIVTKEDLEEFKKSFREELEIQEILDSATEIEKEQGISKTDLLDFMRVAKETDPYKAAEKVSEYQKMAQGKQPETPKPTFTEKSGSSGTHVPPGKKLPSIEDTEGIGKVIEEMLHTPGPEEEI